MQAHALFKKIIAANDFFLDGIKLEFVDSFVDLGILLDTKLDFISHINATANKARGVLAFIKRWAKEFSDPYITRQLYISLVRPILEYGSLIWDPLYKVHSDHIESVQKQFVLFCLRNLRWNSFNLPSYTSRLALIKLPTLKSRRTMLNVSFLMNLIEGNVNSEFLLSNITFKVPVRSLRYFEPLHIQYYQSNHANADPFRRLCANFNELHDFIDFSTSIDVVKNNIIRFLNS